MSAWAMRMGALPQQLRLAKSEGISARPAPDSSPEALRKQAQDNRDAVLNALGGTPSYREVPSPTLRRLKDD